MEVGEGGDGGRCWRGEMLEGEDAGGGGDGGGGDGGTPASSVSPF